MTQDVINLIEQKLKFAPPLNARIKFDLGDDGVMVLDGLTSPAKVTMGDGEAETTIVMTKENLMALANGNLNPTMAFMTGKLKVTGKMGYALKLSSLLEE